MGWQRIESPLDRKLLFRFDPITLRIEIVTRRFSPSTGRLRLREVVELCDGLPPDLAGTLRAAIGGYVRAIHTAGSAALT